jgi:hypothetical protein
VSADLNLLPVKKCRFSFAILSQVTSVKSTDLFWKAQCLPRFLPACLVTIPILTLYLVDNFIKGTMPPFNSEAVLGTTMPTSETLTVERLLVDLPALKGRPYTLNILGDGTVKLNYNDGGKVVAII